MHKKKLDELLAKGTITQAEYDAMLLSVTDDQEQPEEPTEEEPNPEENPPEEDSKPETHLDDEEIQRRAKSIADKSTATLTKKYNEAQKELDRIKRERMTDEQRKAEDIKAREEELAQREQELKDEKNRMYAITAIKKAGIDDGSEEALNIVDFVSGEDEAAIDGHVKAFKALIDKLVNKEVDKRFKTAGRKPLHSNGGVSAKDNPYTKEGWNLTKQMELERTEPEKAKALSEAAEAMKN